MSMYCRPHLGSELVGLLLHIAYSLAKDTGGAKNVTRGLHAETLDICSEIIAFGGDK